MTEKLLLPGTEMVTYFGVSAGVSESDCNYTFI